MSDEFLGVHKTHCCVVHGCKYGDEEKCPVVNGKIRQDNPCEDCEGNHIILNNKLTAIKVIEKKFEYTESLIMNNPQDGTLDANRVSKNRQEMLNEKGNQGWIMCGVQGTDAKSVFYFYREVK